MEKLLLILIGQKEINMRLVLALTLKITTTYFCSNLINNSVHDWLERELASTIITEKEISRKKKLMRIAKNFRIIKYAVRMMLFGILLPINIGALASVILKILKSLSTKVQIRKPVLKPLTDNNVPQLVANTLNKVKEQNVPKDISVPKTLDPVRMQRECELLERFVLNQPKLIVEFNKENVGERVTKYCTTQVEKAIRKILVMIRNKPITEGLMTVKAKSEMVLKALDNLDKLPGNAQRSKDLSKDLSFAMKCLDSYTDILRLNASQENINYLKHRILPDLYVILTAIHNEARK